MPIEETVGPSTGLGALFKHTFSCDWLGQMTTFLQQGWQLVEIFLYLLQKMLQKIIVLLQRSICFGFLRKRLFKLTTLALFMKAVGVSSL